MVAVTANGVQPTVGFKVNWGTIGDSTQIVLTISAEAHVFPPTFNVIVYVPGTVNIGQIIVVPAVHDEGIDELLTLPKEPLFKVNPVAGEITHTIFGLLHEEFVGIFPPVDVFVKQIWLFVQIIFWGTVKFTIGGDETRIGTTDPDDMSQGFDASIFAENEFW